MISREEVVKIAKLARLELTEVEIAKMQKDLSAILDYFNLLKRAPKLKTDRLPMSIKNLMLREDKAVPQKREVAQKIIAASPDKKDDYIKVKAVL